MINTFEPSKRPPLNTLKGKILNILFSEDDIMVKVDIIYEMFNFEHLIEKLEYEKDKFLYDWEKMDQKINSYRSQK